MKTITLPCYGFTLTVAPNGGGSIKSDLLEGVNQTDDNEADYIASVNAITSLVLAHACAGVDVESPAYLEGIETAVQAISNET